MGVATTSLTDKLVHLIEAAFEVRVQERPSHRTIVSRKPTGVLEQEARNRDTVQRPPWRLPFMVQCKQGMEQVATGS